MASKKHVLVVCNRCNEKLQIEIDLEELKYHRKGGLFTVEVPHGETTTPHSTIFYLSFDGERVQVRGQVTADSIAGLIRTASGWKISEEQAESIDQLLKNFLGILPEVELVLIYDNKGRPTGSKVGVGLESARKTYIKTIVNQIIGGVAKSFQSSPMGTSTIEMGDLRIVFVRVGVQAILTVVSDLGGVPDSVLAYTYLVAEKLMWILEGEQVALDIPILEIGELSTSTGKEGRIRYLTVVPGSYMAKLVMVGDEGVGKTSLVRRFVENTFKTDYKPTIGVSIMSKTVKLVGQESQIKFSIHDMAGQEQFARVRHSYFRGAHACFNVFDLTNRTSFDVLKRWYEETLEYAGRSTIFIIIGNKADLVDQREVTTEEALELVRDLNCTYIETSAKTGDNVMVAFSLMALLLMERAERVIEGKAEQDFMVEEYLKGQVLPTSLIEQITNMIAEVEDELERENYGS